jgi:hypothetical protein
LLLTGLLILGNDFMCDRAEYPNRFAAFLDGSLEGFLPGAKTCDSFGFKAAIRLLAGNNERVAPGVIVEKGLHAKPIPITFTGGQGLDSLFELSEKFLTPLISRPSC